jgi:hypothetical protein
MIAVIVLHEQVAVCIVTAAAAEGTYALSEL